MDTTIITAIQAIQAILAPAVGISANGLLLLGMLNRYTMIITRIRDLNAEKRHLYNLLDTSGTLDEADAIRLDSVKTQVKQLVHRSWLMRNAILMTQIAVICFVLTSAFIGLNFFVSTPFLMGIPLVIFVIGMFFVLAGIAFAAIEIYKSFTVIEIETTQDL